MTMKEKDPENKRHQVFISYATEKGDSTVSDRHAADKICSALESGGIRCWMAHRDILPGGDWLNAMIDSVMQSQIMVLVFSSNTNKSPWVVQEVTRALRENITIIPFRIENVSPMRGLRALEDRCQWMDAYTPPLEKHVDRLVSVVHTYLKKEPESPLKVVEKQPEAVEVDVREEKPESVEVDIREEERKGFFQKKWILVASIIVVAAIAYFFRYQLGIVPKEKKRETIQEKVEEMPDDVKVVELEGIKVEKKNNLWEAHYRDGIVMIYIPAGEFTMGSDDGGDDEKPPHKVKLDGYWMGKTEVTVGQYKTFISEAGHRSLPGYVSEYSPGDNHPVVGVSWDDATAYCKWLSKKVGLKFKLPTEAQWEKAARGTKGLKYPWGKMPPTGEKVNFADKQAWVKNKYSWADKNIDDGYAYTAPVESYPKGASPYGMLNMAGNVWEWCRDRYKSDYYKNSPKENPPGPGDGTSRVVRGGSWFNYARNLRCANRFSDRPSLRDVNLGFRLSQDKK